MIDPLALWHGLEFANEVGQVASGAFDDHAAFLRSGERWRSGNSGGGGAASPAHDLHRADTTRQVHVQKFRNGGRTIHHFVDCTVE